MAETGSDYLADQHRTDLGIVDREDSGRSSQLSGEFMQSDPKFESPPGSSTSDSELTNLAPQAPLVTVVWRQLTVVRPFLRNPGFTYRHCMVHEAVEVVADGASSRCRRLYAAPLESDARKLSLHVVRAL